MNNLPQPLYQDAIDEVEECLFVEHSPKNQSRRFTCHADFTGILFSVMPLQNSGVLSALLCLKKNLAVNPAPQK